MAAKIRIGIAGYCNLGSVVEMALARSQDMQLVGIFSRRDPTTIDPLGADVPVYALDAIEQFQDRIDVLILCGGSKNDLPQQGPALASLFNTIDSFDTHNKIPEYFAAVDEAARAAQRTAIIALGWDPGLFSLNRLFGEAILPDGETYTFWGKGLSQGHSDAVRRVPGVKAGVQYTIPSPTARAPERRGDLRQLSTRANETRECYVALAPSADTTTGEQAIVTRPDYFAASETTVNFISEEELRRDHSAMPHGG